MTKRNDKINCGTVMRVASVVQPLEHWSSLPIIPNTTESVYLKNPDSMDTVFSEYRLHAARPYYIAAVGCEGSAAQTTTINLTYFAQKRLQDTTGKANVDHAVEEEAEVVRAFERRIQERRERKECVEELLLEECSETRSLSSEFWKLFEFTEQLSSLSLSLNTLPDL